MNSAIGGVIATLVTLGGIGVMADKGSPPPQAAPVRAVIHFADKGDKPKDKAPAPQPQTPGLSPEQQAALQQAFNLPPGSEVEVEIQNRDMGSVRSRNEGRGVGAGAVAEGDKLDGSFTGTPPSVGFGADGSLSGTGGGADSEQKASALKIPPMPWANPLFWVGLACLGGCGFCVYLGLRRAALICGIGGVGLIAAAFYPVILLFAVAGVLLAVFGPYLYAEFKKKKAEKDDSESYEALRAVVAGVEHRTLPGAISTSIAQAMPAGVNFTANDMTNLVNRIMGDVKAAIAKEADGRDKEVIDEVKREDKVGKYQD